MGLHCASSTSSGYSIYYDLASIGNATIKLIIIIGVCSKTYVSSIYVGILQI